MSDERIACPECGWSGAPSARCPNCGGALYRLSPGISEALVETLPGQTPGPVNSDSAEAQFASGLVRLHAERWDEAIKAFREAIRIKPDFAEAYHFLDQAYARLLRWDEAIQALEAGREDKA